LNLIIPNDRDLFEIHVGSNERRKKWNKDNNFFDKITIEHPFKKQGKRF